MISYLIGMDLYVPAIRLLYKEKIRIHAAIILLALLFLYLINIILTAGVLILFDDVKLYAFSDLPLELALPLLISEHLSAEANRQLNLLGMQKEANIVLLIRSSLPIFLFVAFIQFEDYGVISLIVAQIVGTSLALPPVWFFYKKHLLNNFRSSEISILYSNVELAAAVLKKSQIFIKGCGIAFLTTLFLKACQTLDRQFLAAVADFSRVGVYALIMTVSTAIMSLLDAVLISSALPKLLEENNCNNQRELKNSYLKLKDNLFKISTFLHMAIAVFCILVNIFLDQNKYVFSTIEFILIMCASWVGNYSLVDAAMIFVLNKDGDALRAAILGFLVLIVTIFIFNESFGPNAVALGVFNSAITIFIARRISVNSSPLQDPYTPHKH